jgi:hypothetical protein
VFIPSGHLGEVSVWVCEYLEAFGKTFFAGDQWVEGYFPVVLSG